MALVTHKFKLDLTPGASRQVLYTSQGDIGRPFEADLYWNGSPWTATGTTASIRGRKPDETVFDYTATVDGSTVTFSTTEQMTIISGPVECELVFSNDGDVIASANFVLIVEESPYNPEAPSESEVTGLTEMIQAEMPEAVADWFENDAPASETFANAVQDATDTYLDENGVVVNYEDVIGTPDFEALKNVELVDLLYNVEWEQGSIAPGTGEENAVTNRIRTGYIDVRGIKALTVKVANGYRFVIDWYTDIGTIANSAFGTYFANFTLFVNGVNQNVIIHPNVKYIRFVLANTGDTTITPNEGVNLSVTSDYALYNDVLETKTAVNAFGSWANKETITLSYPLKWVNAISSATDSSVNETSTRICTNFIDIPKYAKTITLTAPEGYDCAYYLYDDNAVELVAMYWANSYTFEVQGSQTRLIIGLRTDNNDTILPTEGNIAITCTFAEQPVQEIEDIIELPTVDLGWEIGSLVPGSGVENTGDKRIRSRYILVGKGTKLIRDSTASGDRHLIYIFDLNKVYVRDLSWTKDDIIVENDCYIRILLNKNDQVITEDQIETIATEEIIYRTFPQYLMDREIYTPPETIPAYFENEIDTAITTARTNIFDAGIDGDSFVFISDVHWPNNSKNSTALIKKAVDELNLDKIICGGDLFNGGAKADSIKNLSDCVNAYKDITRFYCLFGNHDSNTIGAPSTADNFTKSEVYALEQKQSDFVMNYGEPCYFYFDNPTTKTRYICLDTGLEGSSLPTAQSDWITATLNSTPDNYHILVFAHIIYMPTNDYHIGITKDEVYRTSFMNTVCTMCDTFNTNNQNKKVEAIFGGHMHFDADFTTTGGIPIVLIDCDARLTFTETTPGSGTANHAAGTINEQCFDIVSIDYANSTIKCTRVGRGSDRTITY